VSLIKKKALSVCVILGDKNFFLIMKYLDLQSEDFCYFSLTSINFPPFDEYNFYITMLYGVKKE
jgi:hypothetical protein